MADIQLPSPHQLLHKIRFAREPDNPALIQYWLQTEYTGTETRACTDWDRLRLQYHLLLDTINDVNLPVRWRCACLDAIYTPLQRMENLARDSALKREVRRLYFEVTMCRHCSLPKKALH